MVAVSRTLTAPRCRGASVDLPNKAGKTAADLARGREIAAVFNQDEKAVSTELLVCHIQPPYFHLNGRCVINRVRVHVAATDGVHEPQVYPNRTDASHYLWWTPF